MFTLCALTCLNTRQQSHKSPTIPTQTKRNRCGLACSKQQQLKLAASSGYRGSLRVSLQQQQSRKSRGDTEAVDREITSSSGDSLPQSKHHSRDCFGIGFHGVTPAVPLTDSRGRQLASKSQRQRRRRQGEELQQQQQQQEELLDCCPQVSVRLTHQSFTGSFLPPLLLTSRSPNHWDTEPNRTGPELHRRAKACWRSWSKRRSVEKLELQTCTEAPGPHCPAHFPPLLPILPLI